METAEKTQRFGPILLAPGISPNNVVTKLYASFAGVALFSGISFLQSYILVVHLNIPRNQGTLTGDLTFIAEATMLLFLIPAGILADRIGRRPVFAAGMLLISLGYGLYPFAETPADLMFFRFIIALGIAFSAGTLATITNDYPQENSRGKLIGLVSIANTLGTMFIAGVIGRIPVFLTARDFDPVVAGKVMFLFAAFLAVSTAVISHFGLKEGTPVARDKRPSIRILAMSGLRAAKNPRIALSYTAAFAARSDLVIKGAFLSIWALQDGAARGMNPGEAMARFGLMVLIMQGVSVGAAPIFGWFIDQVNRMTATIVALLFAITGYLSMYFLTSPLDFAMVPYFIIISFGSSFMLKVSLSLVGQEAPIAERGSIIAMNSWFGALGILILMVVGGRLYDAWGPWAPFVIAGFYQIFILAGAIIIRIVAPGPMIAGYRPKWFRSRATKPITAGEVSGNTPTE